MSILPILPQGFVVGRILTSRGDSADADKKADTAVVVGMVDFTPATAYRKLDAATVVTHSKITAKLDSHGDLHPQRETSDNTGSDTEDGIWLPVGTWKVTYRLGNGYGSLPEHNIEVTVAHTEAAPLPLFANMGDAPVPGATYVQLTVPLGGQQGQVLVMNDGSLAWGNPVGGGGGGGASTITADDTPAAPAEGGAASYLVTSAVSWPAGLVWSTDPDGGVAPTITGTALVSLFTLGGTTRAILGATFPGVVVPDTTNPTAGTLSSSAVTDTSFTLTVTGADDAGGLHAQPYAFDEGSGTFGAWQTPASKAVTGKTAETAYTCRHKVRDAAGNEATGASITVTTIAAPAPAANLADAILALNPVGYWKLNETSGTQALDYSGNDRHGTYSGVLTLAGRDGFVQFGGEGARALIPADTAWELGASTAGWSAFTLLYPTGEEGSHHVVSACDAFAWPNKYSQRLRATDWGISLAATLDGFTNAELNKQRIPTRAGSWHAIGWGISNPGPATSVTLHVSDEAPTSTTAAIGDYVPNLLPLSLGALNGPGYVSKNAMGHAAVFPYELTEAQFGALVAAARADGLIP